MRCQSHAPRCPRAPLLPAPLRPSHLSRLTRERRASSCSDSTGPRPGSLHGHTSRQMAHPSVLTKQGTHLSKSTYHFFSPRTDLPPLGVTGAPGPVVTKSGILFFTGGGSVLYALDTQEGSVRWEHDLGGVGYAVPMTYETANRQFVVIATGAGEDATLKAFALPTLGSTQ